jgi:hypothetical protein
MKYASVQKLIDRFDILLHMSEYQENKKKEEKMDIFTRSVHRDYQNGTNDVELAAEILSEGLDQPDWHLKYARNIIYLVLFIAGTVLIDSFLFTYKETLSGVGPTLRILMLLIVIGIACVCGFFDNILDQESTEVRWFNYVRFWFVLLFIGIPLLMLTIYAAMWSTSAIANF